MMYCARILAESVIIFQSQLPQYYIIRSRSKIIIHLILLDTLWPDIKEATTQLNGVKLV